MQKNMTRREALATLAGLGLTGILAGCGTGASDSSASDSSKSGGSKASKAKAKATDDVVVRVASLKGPTTIGLVKMMDTTSGIPTDGAALPEDNSAKKGSGITYAYAVSASPDELLPQIIQGKVDIACVPSNVGSVLYNKTEGKIRVIDVNTLGVLSVVTGDSSVAKFEDLAGKTVYVSGKGSSPEYVLDFLLGKAGIADIDMDGKFVAIKMHFGELGNVSYIRPNYANGLDPEKDVTIEWKSEHAEVAAILASDPAAVGILPQPFTTATLVQNGSLKAPVDLTDVWKEYATDGSEFVMGATIVRAAFADEHPEAVEDFLKRHAKSVKQVNADPKAAAPLVVKAGIVPKEPIAQKAIPQCNVVCITGKKMRRALEGYLQVLYDANKASVGGALPADDFYYQQA